jgi:diadenosine tetraphosphate (Ap4A) HIT family hydrolase
MAIMNCELCNTNGENLLWRNQHCRVILINDADYPGFCRVIWGNHTKEMTDLTPQQRHELMSIVFTVESVVREIMQPDKVNLASLGNMTPHLHWHVIPRYKNDKHFPNPIWATPLRSSHIPNVSDIHTRLSNLLQTKLST